MDFLKKVGSFLVMKRKRYVLFLLLILWGILLALSGCNKGDSSDQLLEVELDALEEGGEGESAKEQGEGSESEEQVDNSPVFVHVCGAVNHPGVVELKGNKRVFEAIDLAGGLREDAAVSYINLARMVEDGERVYVPNLEEIAKLNDGRLDIHLFLEMVGSGENSNSSAASSGKVNINQAGLDELMTLSGIGPSKARSIMDYREQHGRFNTIEELMNVSGIGTSTFEKIKEFVTL